MTMVKFSDFLTPSLVTVKLTQLVSTLVCFLVPPTSLSLRTLYVHAPLSLVQTFSMVFHNREKIVITVAPTYTLGYFLGYNMIGSFLITLLVPVVTLGTFNTLIWRRLQEIWRNRSV